MYAKDSGTPGRVEYGIGLAAGLGMFPETAAHAPVLEQITTDLDAAYETRRDEHKQVVKTRVALRIADYHMDQTIRSAARAAEIHDGGRKGPVYGVLFPEGLRPVVLPNLARQIPPTEALVERLMKTKTAGIDAYRNEWMPKLQGALANLKQAAQNHETAKKAYDDAFGTELSLRDQHATAVDQIAGHVRAAFPKDREKQDLIFPDLADDGAPAKPATPVTPTAAPATPAAPPAAPTNGG
jgi:hypothetical protein